jgi:hypothetical protein
MPEGECARYTEHPKFVCVRARGGVMVMVCALCSVFKLCFGFDHRLVKI